MPETSEKPRMPGHFSLDEYVFLSPYIPLLSENPEQIPEDIRARLKQAGLEPGHGDVEISIDEEAATISTDPPNDFGVLTVSPELRSRIISRKLQLKPNIFQKK